MLKWKKTNHRRRTNKRKQIHKFGLYLKQNKQKKENLGECFKHFLIALVIIN